MLDKRRSSAANKCSEPHPRASPADLCRLCHAYLGATASLGERGPPNLLTLRQFEWMLELTGGSRHAMGQAPNRFVRPRLHGLQPLAEFRPAAPARYVTHRDSDGFLLPDQYDQPLTTRYAGVEQVPLQHRIVLGHDGDNDGWIFGALALVDRGGIGRNQHVELTKSVGEGSAVETSE